MNATEQKLFRLRDLANRLQRLRAIDAEVWLERSDEWRDEIEHAG